MYTDPDTVDTCASSDAGAPSTATGASEYALMHSVVLTGSRGVEPDVACRGEGERVGGGP